jgi:5-methylcytosine-specific restriction protein A
VKTHAEGRTQTYAEPKRSEWLNAVEQRDLLYPAGLQTSAIPVTVVCGAPGSGKNRYVESHAGAGDLIIDVDQIQAELSGLPLHHAGKSWFEPAVRERNRRLASLCTVETGKAWFICSAPKAWQREHWAKSLSPVAIVVLLVPAADCVARMECDRRRPRTTLEELERRANRWWSDYTPRHGDTLIGQAEHAPRGRWAMA